MLKCSKIAVLWYVQICCWKGFSADWHSKNILWVAIITHSVYLTKTLLSWLPLLSTVARAFFGNIALFCFAIHCDPEALLFLNSSFLLYSVSFFILQWIFKVSAFSLEFQFFFSITREFFLTVGQNNFGNKIHFSQMFSRI